MPKGAIVLISGTPGTGKSILCSQVLYRNAVSGKKCLYLNLEQNEGRLENQMRQFGWEPEKAKNLKIVAIDSSNSKLVEYLLKEIQSVTYDLIVLDSLDSISSNPSSTKELKRSSIEVIEETTIPTLLDTSTIGRIKLKKIFSAIAKSKATALVTTEKVEGDHGISRDTISEFLCDGIIILKSLAVGKTFNRTIQVAKMRLTEADCTIRSLAIQKTGIFVE